MTAPEPDLSPPPPTLRRRRLAAAGVALAVSLGGVPRAAVAAPPLPGARALHETPLHHVGISVGLGGGVTAFSDERTRGALGTGGYWEVRGLLGARSFFGNELAYVGSARAIKDAGAGGQLLGNGMEMGARLALPVRFEALRLAPFLFVGPGFSRLSIVGRDAVPPGTRSADNVFVLTSGAGLAVTWRRAVLGARFTSRKVFGADLVQIGDEGARMQSWSFCLTAGYELAPPRAHD